jgi:alkylresorcinol/alkylpyrone synthase
VVRHHEWVRPPGPLRFRFTRPDFPNSFSNRLWTKAEWRNAILIHPELPMPRLRAVGTALPEHYVDQETLMAAFREAWEAKGGNPRVIDRMHQAVQVAGRYLSIPMADYYGLDSFAKSNQAWARVAPEVGRRAVEAALSQAGLSSRDVDHIFFVSTTGIAVPSIDAVLVNRLGMRTDLKRTPIFGLGCVAGAAGIARASDYARAFPGQVCLLLSVELCSLTLQKEDLSIANIVASGLFGDGAAAVIVEGGAREGASGPQVLDSRSVFYPNSEQMMGWEIVAGGFKIVLNAGVPALVREHLRDDVDAFLAVHGLKRRNVSHWIAHTGGPKVLQAIEQSLELPAAALQRSWDSLKNTGNLSSASVLFVLGKLLEEGAARPGDYGLLMAMGPGFCSEMVLLRW